MNPHHDTYIVFILLIAMMVGLVLVEQYRLGLIP